MNKIYLRTIFIVVAVSAVFSASVASHWQARNKFAKKLRSVTVAMKNANSEIESKLVDQLLEDPNLTGPFFRQLAAGAVHCEGSNRIAKEGSLFSGQGYVHEYQIDILSSNVEGIMKFKSVDITKVSVIIRCETAWAVFSGEPSVTFTSQGFPLDGEYIEVIERMLTENEALEFTGG